MRVYAVVVELAVAFPRTKDVPKDTVPDFSCWIKVAADAKKLRQWFLPGSWASETIHTKNVIGQKVNSVYLLYISIICDIYQRSSLTITA